MVSHRLRTIRGLALVAGAALVVLACGGSSSGPARPAREAGALDTAPDFTLENVNGEQVRFSDLDGKVRLIDFWATWCSPCREEIPMLKDLHQIYGDRGFALLAISDENPDVIREFVQQNEIPYPNLIDPGEVSAEYKVTSLPTAFLVDREGHVVEAFRGTKIRKVLEARIQELLGDAPGA